MGISKRHGWVVVSRDPVGFNRKVVPENWWLQPPKKILVGNIIPNMYIYIQLYINISQIVLKINMSKTTDQFISNINPWNFGPPGSKWLQMYTTQRLDIPNADPNYGNLGLSWKPRHTHKCFAIFERKTSVPFWGYPSGILRWHMPAFVSSVSIR